MWRALIRSQVFKSIVSIIVKMASTYKAGLTLCGAFLVVFCLVRLQDLAGRESQGRTIKVRRFLLLVNCLRQGGRLTAMTVQPDLVLGVLGEGIVDGEIGFVLKVIVKTAQSIVESK